MKASADCVSCQVAFALQTVRKATDDEDLAERLVLKALEVILSFGLEVPPPRVAREIVNLVREQTGVEDPYRDDKERQNHLALKLYPRLKARVEKALDPLKEALFLSALGNLMDSIAQQDEGPSELLCRALSGTHFLHDHYGELVEGLQRATNLLIVGDNAGEIVMDKLLVEVLKGLYPALQIVYAVRGRPTINDATMEDARSVGMMALCRVITTGDSTPGVIFDFCSPEFRKAFEGADLLIAKGQGNFETLEELRDPRLFFLLWVKCPTISRYLKLPTGGPVMLRSPL